MPFIAIALLLAVALGGGTAAAAEASLPGDALWGFKVSVNENLQGVLAPSAEAKADWNIGVINTRLAEAETLAAEGRLDARAQAQIQANIDLHTKALTGTVAYLETNGEAQAAADVAARYQSTVAASADSLAKVDASADAEARVSLSPIMAQVRAALEGASTLSAGANTAAAAEAGAGVDIGL